MSGKRKTSHYRYTALLSSSGLNLVYPFPSTYRNGAQNLKMWPYLE